MNEAEVESTSLGAIPGESSDFSPGRSQERHALDTGDKPIASGIGTYDVHSYLCALEQDSRVPL